MDKRLTNRQNEFGKCKETHVDGGGKEHGTRLKRVPENYEQHGRGWDGGGRTRGGDQEVVVGKVKVRLPASH